MNRRSFLKFCGFLPGLVGEAISNTGILIETLPVSSPPLFEMAHTFDWDDFGEWWVEEAIKNFKAEHTHKNAWKRIIARDFRPVNFKDHSLYSSFIKHCNRPRIGVQNEDVR